MIHLKYKCKINFVKLPLIRTDLGLKLVFGNATAGRNTRCRSVVNCAGARRSFRWLFLMRSAASKMRLSNASRVTTFHCKPVLSSIPIHNNPVGVSLEYRLANCVDRHVRSIAQVNDSSGNL